MGKITLTINQDNKDFLKAKNLSEGLSHVRRSRFEYLFFLLALFSGLIFNLFASILDGFVRTQLQQHYLIYEIAISIISLLIMVIIGIVVYHFYKLEEKYENEFYKIYLNNPKRTFFNSKNLVKGEKFDYKVIRKYTKKTISYKYGNRKPQGIFWILEIEIVSSSRKTIKYNHLDFHLLDKDENIYDYEPYSTNALEEEKKISINNFMPDKKYRIVLSFDVPITSEIKYFNFAEEKYYFIDLTK